MAGNDYQVPDLQSVLQTLASLAPQAAAQGQYPPHRPGFQGHPFQSLQSQPQISPPAKAPEQKGPDPTVIIDWSSGLRSVMKTVAANDDITKEIRRMITVQHEHEDQWWKGRQALIEKQKARKEGQKKLDEVLKAVGGAISEAGGRPGPESAAEELKTFDMKVYRAQHQMVKEFSVKLRNMGVPFFGTRSDLIRKADSDPVPGSKPKDLQASMKSITEKELVELQRKMLGLLEEMCRDYD